MNSAICESYVCLRAIESFCFFVFPFVLLFCFVFVFVFVVFFFFLTGILKHDLCTSMQCYINFPPFLSGHMLHPKLPLQKFVVVGAS